LVPPCLVIAAGAGCGSAEKDPGAGQPDAVLLEQHGRQHGPGAGKGTHAAKRADARDQWSHWRKGDRSIACDSGVSEPTLRAAVDLGVTCERNMTYEVFDVRTLAGEYVPYGDYECRWTFDDRETSAACAGVHSFAMAGLHSASVLVRQRSTDAQVILTGTHTVYDAIQVRVEASAPECGLSFEYTVTKSGGLPGFGWQNGSITPEESVVTPGPYGASGVIEVSAPGTYLLQFTIEQEHQQGPFCLGSGSTEVTVRECPPPPNCD
jgi:hypothetical protein